MTMDSKNFKLAIIGHPGAGKTVLIGGLALAKGLSLTYDTATGEYVKRIQNTLQKPEWPAPDQKGQIDHLTFNLQYNGKNVNLSFDSYAGEIVDETGFLKNVVGDAKGIILLLNTGILDLSDIEQESRIKSFLSIIKTLAKSPNKPVAVAIVVTACDRLETQFQGKKEKFFGRVKELEDCLKENGFNYGTYLVTVTGKLEDQNSPRIAPEHIEEPFQWLIDQNASHECRKKVQYGLNRTAIIAGCVVFLGLIFALGVYGCGRYNLYSLESEIGKIKRNGDLVDDWAKYRNDLFNIRAEQCTNSHFNKTKHSRLEPCSEKCWKEKMLFYPCLKNKYKGILEKLETEIDKATYYWLDLRMDSEINRNDYSVSEDDLKNCVTKQQDLFEKYNKEYLPAKAKFFANEITDWKYDSDLSELKNLSELKKYYSEWEEAKSALEGNEQGNCDKDINAKIEDVFRKKIKGLKERDISDFFSETQTSSKEAHPFPPRDVLNLLKPIISNKVGEVICKKLDDFKPLQDTTLHIKERKDFEKWWNEINRSLTGFDLFAEEQKNWADKVKNDLDAAQNNFAEKILDKLKDELKKEQNKEKKKAADYGNYLSLWKNWHKVNDDEWGEDRFRNKLKEVDDMVFRHLANVILSYKKNFSFDELGILCEDIKKYSSEVKSLSPRKITAFANDYLLWKNGFRATVNVSIDLSLKDEGEITNTTFWIEKGEFSCGKKQETFRVGSKEESCNKEKPLKYKKYFHVGTLDDCKICITMKKDYPFIKEHPIHTVFGYFAEREKTYSFNLAKEGVLIPEKKGVSITINERFSEKEDPQDIQIKLIFSTESSTFKVDDNENNDCREFPVIFAEFFKQCFGANPTPQTMIEEISKEGGAQ